MAEAGYEVGPAGALPVSEPGGNPAWQNARLLQEQLRHRRN